MPNLEGHCKRTLKKYGVEGRDIHEWLDKPSRKYASGHRQFRHDTETIKLVGEIFDEKYGKSLAENIALDHIMLDHEKEVKDRQSKIVFQIQEKERATIPCPYCSTLLKSTDQQCPNCGAPRKKILAKFDREYEMQKIILQEKKKELRKELKREYEMKKWTLEEKIRQQKLRRKFLHSSDPLLDKLIEEDLKKHPRLKEKLERSKKTKYTVTLILSAVWAVLLTIGGVAIFGSPGGGDIGGIVVGGGFILWLIGTIFIYVFIDALTLA